MALTPRQARFVEEYLVDGVGARAAERANYSPRTAKQQASRLLTIPAVAEAIREGEQRRSERVEVKQSEVLRELKVIAFAEPGEKYRASDKTKALELLGKFLALWTDKTELAVGCSWEQLVPPRRTPSAETLGIQPIAAAPAEPAAELPAPPEPEPEPPRAALEEPPRPADRPVFARVEMDHDAVLNHLRG